MLVDIFPQPEEFEVPPDSPIWAYSMPVEFTEIVNKLDEIAWSSLVGCVIGTEEEFDAGYDQMIADMEDSDMAEAERHVDRNFERACCSGREIIRRGQYEISQWLLAVKGGLWKLFTTAGI